MRRALDPKAGYARYAHQYDDREFFWDSFEQDALKDYIKSTDGKEVLDAGAGTGRLTVKLHEAGAHVTALDISPDMLAILERKQAEIKTVMGDMLSMPFQDDSFDMVFSSLAMFHLKKIEVTPFLDECYRVLKDDGLLVLVNIHYRKAEILQDGQGRYTIAGYNHFPRHVRKAAEALAFGVEKDELLTEGDDVWVSQVLVLRK